jgi:hypothetical protein
VTPPVVWLEIAVPAHAEAVEAVSEILSRVGYNGIAVEVPLERGVGADHTVKAYVVEDADAAVGRQVLGARQLGPDLRHHIPQSGVRHYLLRGRIPGIMRYSSSGRDPGRPGLPIQALFR